LRTTHACAVCPDPPAPTNSEAELHKLLTQQHLNIIPSHLPTFLTSQSGAAKGKGEGNKRRIQNIEFIREK
jgi:hypothetical protein